MNKINGAIRKNVAMIRMPKETSHVVFIQIDDIPTHPAATMVVVLPPTGANAPSLLQCLIKIPHPVDMIVSILRVVILVPVPKIHALGPFWESQIGQRIHCIGLGG